MNTIKSFIACSLFLLAFAGCDLTAINENPNEPTEDVNYNLNDARLASVFRSSIPTMEGDDEQRIKSLTIDFFAQMLDGGAYAPKNYRMEEDWNQRMYRRIQSSVASMNIVIRSLSDKEDQFAKAIAVAKIWRVFIQSNGVDYFGPIPFAKYTETEDNSPYKSVEESYTEFFKELEEAVALLDKNSSNDIFNGAASDIMFGNDADRWRKFANSLRLRLALRVSEVNPSLCTAQATAAIQSGVMESSGDNACLPPKADGGWGQDYNYTMFQITWGGPLLMTSSFEKLVTGIGGIDFPTGLTNKRAALTGNAATPLSAVHPAKVDPRAPIMFDPANENGDWHGIPYGLSSTDYGSGIYRTLLWPELGILIKNGVPYKNRPYDVFLYEEVCFLKAEAALRGFIAGDAKAEYEKGVHASFATWGVADKAAAYLASTAKNAAGTSANFNDVFNSNGNTQLEKIITQKYLGLFPDMSMEAWNDKRRLNLPRMDVGISRDELLYNNGDRNILKPGNFIKRVQYPQNETQINKAEYDKGVALLGGKDVVSTPIWWDKNANYCTSVE